MTASPFGLLLIAGSQTHQENYARAFAADDRCRLIGLTDEDGVPARRRALNRQLANELGIPLLDDLQAALARDDVHLVSVCAEPERRGRLAALCAQAGKHVYLDKPMAASVADAKRVVAAVQQAGVKSQMFSLVHTAVSQRARALLETGRLGTLLGLHCELLFAKGTAGTAELGRARVEQAEPERFSFIDSKRELFCVGLYPLVLFQWLTGQRFTDVAATTSNYFFAEHQHNNVEDFACLMAGTDGGLDVTLTVGRTGWMSHPGFGVHQVHLVGSDDVVTLDAYQPRLEISSDAPAWRPPEVPHPEDPMGFWSSTQQEAGVEPKTDWFPVAPALQCDASCFLDCIEQDRESDVSAEVGAHAVEAIFAGYAAASQGQPVTELDS